MAARSAELKGVVGKDSASSIEMPPLRLPVKHMQLKEGIGWGNVPEPMARRHRG
ncbi:hypothetical protein [Rhizobium sp. SEMIA 4085]|uniref:hypothetical protein n=1 Tax=Rhizobium sp. SEMIA 4085 TaxID=2137761 RepID=UPI000AE83B81|nr:hypothetical protein [Rhizobium sp. SEMIA 4085]